MKWYDKFRRVRVMRMKLFAIWVAALVLFPAGGSAAHEGDGAETGGVRQVTGEVVDLACYLGHGALGEKHRDCAQKCISSGLPVGIKTAEGLYLAVGSDHEPANKALAPLAGKTVTAEGEVTEKDGVHLIAIKKVTVKTT